MGPGSTLALEAGLIQDWARTNAKRAAHRKKRKLQRSIGKKRHASQVRYCSFPNSQSRSPDCNPSAEASFLPLSLLRLSFDVVSAV
jgi:hypothetical protein